MQELLLLPEAISLTEFIFLVVLSFFTSFISASIGIGGGTVLIAVMAQIVPTKAIIPVHGVVQIGSNFGRAAVLLKHVKQVHLLWFIIGGLVGAVIGGQLVVELPAAYLKLILGCFILYSVWAPKPKSANRSVKRLSISGAISTFLTMFVGATGPFVMASLRPFGFKPTELVATNAACLVSQHSLKIIIFGFLGFAFSSYLALIALMVCTGFLGTLTGRKVLLKVNEEKFRRVLNLTLSLLAIRLVYTGLTGSFFN